MVTPAPSADAGTRAALSARAARVAGTVVPGRADGLSPMGGARENRPPGEQRRERGGHDRPERAGGAHLIGHEPVGDGFRHEALLYSSDDEFLAVAVPFVGGAVAAGGPVVVSLPRRLEDLLLDALGSATGLTLMDGGAWRGGPQSALRAAHDMLAAHPADDGGAPAVRLLAGTPAHGAPDAWSRWARHEAAMDHLLAGHPVWALCPYDRRTTPARVLDGVGRCHPHLTTASGGPRPSDHYRPPAEVLARLAREESDPLESSAPAVALDDPRPDAARRAVGSLARAQGLDGDGLDDIVRATGEVVTNALLHGRPPVRLRAWGTLDRIVVTVRDAGPGPADPFAGLLPRASLTDEGGRGLAIAYGSCDRVALVPGDDGFTVRLVLRTPLGRSLVGEA